MGGVGTENSRVRKCAWEPKTPQNHAQDRSRTTQQLDKREKNENRAPVYTGALLLGFQPTLFSLFWGVLGRSWGHVGVFLEGFGSEPEKRPEIFLASGRLLPDLRRVFCRLAVSSAPFSRVPGPTSSNFVCPTPLESNFSRFCDDFSIFLLIWAPPNL